jgi:hypothetical protein
MSKTLLVLAATTSITVSFLGRRLLKRVAGVVLPVPALPVVWLPALSWAVP